MCRVYGKGDRQYVRLCYLTSHPGWQLYFQGLPPLQHSGHVAAKDINSGKYRIESAPPRKGWHKNPR